jgi:ABC-type polysaccharide/polyol phosphate transport system ATPase subunit
VEPAVALTSVSKVFRIRRNRAYSLKIKLLGYVNPRLRERTEELWALRDIDLVVHPGESIGVIGANGCGKSTLLRVACGIFPPSHGRVSVRGTLAPILELGAGFHPELTGRENVYLNTSLYRLSRREVDALYRHIVAFAELEDFIDLPVKNYSSGMYLRLGFAIAAHLEPDILVVDEVLSVGDERFAAKCQRRMEEIRRAGKTIILVSHAMDAVEQMTDRCCLLVKGRLEEDGEPAKVIERYRELLHLQDP